MIDSPSSGVPTKAPRWDLVDIEGYGGGNSFFVVASDVFGVHGYMEEEEVGRWTPEGPTRVGGVPTCRGRAGHPRGRLLCGLTSTPSPLDRVCSKKIAPEGFIPFGLRLIFLFFETLK